MKSEINSVPVIIALVVVLLSAAVPTAGRARENAYTAAHRLVWAASEEQISPALDAVPAEEANAVDTQRLMRMMERNSVQMIRQLTRDIDTRLMETLNIRAH